ncbi:hypothetical protein [Caulobacter segnis]
MARVEPPRIGTGKGYFIAGWIVWGLGLFCAMAAAGGGTGAGAIASLLAAVGAGCFAVGFWVKLFGALERRLIDIQHAIAPRAESAPVTIHREPTRDLSPPPPPPPARPSDLEARSGV